MSPAPKRRSGHSGRSALLENCVEPLHLIGFQIYDSYPQYMAAEAAGGVPARYIVKQYPHPTLYGGRGRKEAFIHTPEGDFILEAKWQETSGSVDEKIPYIWEAFLASDVPNWLVVMDGRYWREGRGKTVVAWLSHKAELYRVRQGDLASILSDDPRSLRVFNRMDFIKFATGKWGVSTVAVPA